MARQLPEIHSGQWAEMGNQQGKGGKRAAPGQTYPFDEPEKKSRTDWTAGKRPDDPLDQFSLLPTPPLSLCPPQPSPCELNPVQWLCILSHR